jgi:hypothetical protein
MADATTREAAPEPVDAEELIALIKAIKFAYEDYGYKRVHEQIKTHGDKFARVPLKRVKKYMQKLGLANSAQADDAEADGEATETQADGKPDLKAQAKASAKGGAIQLMTIGGESKSERPSDLEAEVATSDSAWQPVKLDEPMYKTAQSGYNAVIRMTASDEGDAAGAMGEIYKIQVAVEADGSLSSGSPMLVYNKARNRKTFMHPDSPAYHPVQRLIKTRGLSGVVGGSKAFFWGRYRQQDDMVYINTEKLAPFQQW